MSSPKVRSKCSVANKRARGFTFIEIMFAVLLLSAGMITLLGLQASNSARTRDDRNKIRAMLAARQILAAIEMTGAAIPVKTYAGSVQEVVGQLMTPPTQDPQEEKAMADLSAEVSVEEVPLLNLGPDPQVLERIHVSVYWGNGPFDVFQTTYFIPGQ